MILKGRKGGGLRFARPEEITPVDSLVIPTFERESRYLVYKRSDLAKAGLTSAEVEALASISTKIAELRSLEGRDPLKCVLVESDWPEYEPTWRAIEKRMKG